MELKFSYYFTFKFFITVLAKFQIEIRFSLNCTGIQTCQSRHVYHHLEKNVEPSMIWLFCMGKFCAGSITQYVAVIMF